MLFEMEHGYAPGFFDVWSFVRSGNKLNSMEQHGLTLPSTLTIKFRAGPPRLADSDRVPRLSRIATAQLSTPRRPSCPLQQRSPCPFAFRKTLPFRVDGTKRPLTASLESKNALSGSSQGVPLGRGRSKSFLPSRGTLPKGVLATVSPSILPRCGGGCRFSALPGCGFRPLTLDEGANQTIPSGR